MTRRDDSKQYFPTNWQVIFTSRRLDLAALTLSKWQFEDKKEPASESGRYKTTQNQNMIREAGLNPASLHFQETKSITELVAIAVTVPIPITTAVTIIITVVTITVAVVAKIQVIATLVAIIAIPVTVIAILVAVIA